MSLYMLHTDIVTDLIQARSPTLDGRIAATAPHELCISAVTRGELLCALSRQTKAAEPELDAPGRKGNVQDKVESLRKTTHAVLAKLTPREAKVLRRGFGMDMSPDLTLENVDKLFAAMRERQQLTPREASALRRQFGLYARADHTLEDIDEQLDASAEPIHPGERPDLLSELVDRFLTRVPCLPWDAEAATHFARIAVDLHLLGSPMGTLDTMIAGHAVAVGAVLVTNSERHFARITGLKVENWTRAPKR
jgi:predicted nucleic acid-binding protein